MARNRTVGLYSRALRFARIRDEVIAKRGAVAPVVESEPVESGPVEHVTRVLKKADGKHWPSCVTCGWSSGHGMTERGAKGQATKHRNSEAAKTAEAGQTTQEVGAAPVAA